jgi:hypothetical protein
MHTTGISENLKKSLTKKLQHSFIFRYVAVYRRPMKLCSEGSNVSSILTFFLQRVTMEHNAASPVKNSELVEALGDWAGAPAHVRLRAASAAASLSAAGGITSEQLLATKQFRPFEDTVAAARGDVTPAVGVLLSAPEKIRELTKLVEAGRMERERLAREVEDVQVHITHAL